MANTSVPDKPGVYEVRADFEFGRLKGASPLVTIGSTETSLKKRLCEQRIGDPIRYQNRAEKWLIQAGHELQFRYTTTDSGKEARCLEAIRLMEYENEHYQSLDEVARVLDVPPKVVSNLMVYWGVR